MPSNKTELIKIQLPQGADVLNVHQLACWKKEEDKFNIHIFSVVFENEKELMAGYESIRDDIAIYFQSQSLSLDIERWNLYLFYFVGGAVGEDHKQKIEQDKFSMRKIVADRLILPVTEESIQEKIIKELFTFAIGPRIMNKQSVIEFLEKDNKDVVNFLKKDNAASSGLPLLKSLLNLLGNG